MMQTQRQKEVWKTRLWFAEFGWDEEKLETMPAWYGQGLIRAHNAEMSEQERQARLRQRRNR